MLDIQLSGTCKVAEMRRRVRFRWPAILIIGMEAVSGEQLVEGSS
jgi:hypothetical protein